MTKRVQKRGWKPQILCPFVLFINSSPGQAKAEISIFSREDQGA